MPPSSADPDTSDDEFDSMFLEPCSQEITDALDEMEHPNFVFSQCRSQSQSSPLPPVYGQTQLEVDTALDLCASLKNRYLIFRHISAAALTVNGSVSINLEPSSLPATMSSPPATPPAEHTVGRKRAHSVEES
jgi:hypothetical protein